MRTLPALVLIEEEIQTHLKEKLDVEKPWTTLQSGFKQGRSTLLNARRIKKEVKRAAKERHPTYFLFLDFKKAFDTVSRAAIM